MFHRQNNFYRGPVVGNVSRIMTMSVAAAPDWDSLFKLDQYCINVVEFLEG